MKNRKKTSFCKNASAVLLSFCILPSCGFKAAPSPLLDEQERFAPEISDRQQTKAKDQENKPQNIFLPEKKLERGEAKP